MIQRLERAGARKGADSIALAWAVAGPGVVRDPVSGKVFVA
ncbi:hypothetical protein [Thioalkalivibrio sulfidiphilus]